MADSQPDHLVLLGERPELTAFAELPSRVHGFVVSEEGAAVPEFSERPRSACHRIIPERHAPKPRRGRIRMKAFLLSLHA